MKKIMYFLIIIILLILTPIKLFTVEVTMEMDPTVVVATTQKVMLNNYIKISSEDENVNIKEFCEKNSFNPIRIDDNWDIWYDTIIAAWWIVFIISIILAIKAVNKKLKIN